MYLSEKGEQYLINESVTFNPKDGYLIAVLPFISKPGEKLHPNRYIAEKILKSHMRQLGTNKQAHLDVLAAHEKLCFRGYVVPLSDLNPQHQEWILAHHEMWYVIPWRAV